MNTVYSTLYTTCTLCNVHSTMDAQYLLETLYSRERSYTIMLARRAASSLFMLDICQPNNGGALGPGVKNTAFFVFLLQNLPRVKKGPMVDE